MKAKAEIAAGRQASKQGQIIHIRTEQAKRMDRETENENLSAQLAALGRDGLDWNLH